MANRTCSDDDRFNARVDRNGPNGCWLWTAGQSEGYGLMSLGTRRKRMRAHRWAYQRFVGPIPEGLVVDHKCWNRLCVNPEHLRLTDRVGNAQNVPGPPRNNTSGERGVAFDKRRGTWFIYADLNYKRTYGGAHFRDFDEAVKAVRELRNRLHTLNDIDRIA